MSTAISRMLEMLDVQGRTDRLDELEAAFRVAIGKLCPYCEKGLPLNRDGDMHIATFDGGRFPVNCRAVVERAVLEKKR